MQSPQPETAGAPNTRPRFNPIFSGSPKGCGLSRSNGAPIRATSVPTGATRAPGVPRAPVAPPRSTSPDPSRALVKTMQFCSLALAILALLPGCQSARVADPLTRTVGGNDADQQLAFWHGLADRPVTSNDEAFHGLLMFANDGDDPAGDYPGRVAALKARGMLPASFDQPADQSVDRGTVAVALTKVLNIRGGVIMRVLGPSPRYAVRELQYLNLYPPSSQNQTFSGSEFLGIIGKAEEYQNVGTRGSKAVDVQAEEGGGPNSTESKGPPPGDRPPPASTQKAPYPPIPRDPEPAQPPAK